MTLGAIETAYCGYRFRSRLEARWAVFLDAVDLGYRYESEGFDLDGVRYLPDFWLPKLAIWLEIKPTFPAPEEIEKARALARLTTLPCVIVHGDLRAPTGDPWELAVEPPDAAPAATGIMCYPDGTYSGLYWWCECPRCGTVNIAYEGRALASCPQCFDAERSDECGNTQATQRIVTAFAAARRARFEFAR